MTETYTSPQAAENAAAPTAEELNSAATKKQDAFVRLAKTRTSAVLKRLKILAHLGSRSNYEYTPEQIDKMFGALEEGLEDARKAFADKKATDFEF